MFRITQINPELQSCAKYDYQQWKKIEKATWRNIINMRGGLNIGPKENPDIKSILQNQLEDGDEVLDHKEIMRRWPALSVQSNYIGIYSRDMGFIDVKAALRSVKELAEKKGAKFSYKSRVISIDEEKKQVKVQKDGSISNISYNVGVVMCLGPYSPGFKEDKTVTRIETQYFKIIDSSGMPKICLFYDKNPLYWLPNQPDEQFIKIGLHCERSFFGLIERIRKLLPSKQDELSESQACFYTLRKPDKGLQIYRQGSIIWAYGYNGHGFKHGPSIGKMVANKVKEVNIRPKL